MLGSASGATARLLDRDIGQQRCHRGAPPGCSPGDRFRRSRTDTVHRALNRHTLDGYSHDRVERR